MTTEKDLLAAYDSNRKLTEKVEALEARERVAEQRAHEAARLAALPKPKDEPPAGVPAAPPVTLPRNTTEYLALPIVERERLPDDYFDQLLAMKPGVRLGDGLNGHLYAPGELRTGHSGPDIRAGEETRARLVATVKRTYGNSASPLLHEEGPYRRPSTPTPAPTATVTPRFTPPAPRASARK